MNLKWEKQLIVGRYGESLIKKHFEQLGYISYQPTTKDKAHPFDNLFINNSDVSDMFACDVKTKPKRDKYPDTGVDWKHYLKYEKIKKEKNIPFYIYFVDVKLKSIYGAELNDLLKEYNTHQYTYPLQYYSIKQDETHMYFHLKNMKKIRELTPKEVKILNLLNNLTIKQIQCLRNYIF